MDTELITNKETEKDKENNIQKALDLLLKEVKGQKIEISQLRQEVKGTVETEVQKLKEAEIDWKNPGNKIQFKFNADIKEQLTQLKWSIDNNKIQYAEELIEKTVDKVNNRNKLIRIADTSEGGWETVKEYTANPLASDSDDESKIRKAENRAVKKKKDKSLASKKGSGNGRYNPYSGAHLRHGWGSPVIQPGTSRGIQGQPFRTGAPTFGANAFGGRPRGACFGCGEYSHMRRDCPYVNRGTGRGGKVGTSSYTTQ